MRNLETGATMIEADGFLTEELSALSRIDVPRCRWSLAQIASIVTTDTLASAQARADAVRQARTRRTLTGAAIGGAVDFTIGNDSILDGVLLGAAFGYLTSDSPQQITAKVGIIFNDGEALSLEVTAREYTLLQTAAHQALAQPEADRTRPAQTNYEVGLYDAEDILGRRQHGEARSLLLLAIGGSCAMGFATIIISTVLRMQGGDPSPVARVFLAAAAYMPWLAGAVVCLAMIYTIFPFRSPQSCLLDDAERRAFARLKDAESKPVFV